MRAKRPAVPASTPILDEAGVPRHLIGQLSTEWTKVVKEGPNSQRLLQDEIDKLRLKWSRLRSGMASSLREKPDILVTSSTSLGTDPGTVFVVFRRLPLLIRYSTRNKDTTKPNADESVIWETYKPVSAKAESEPGLWRIIKNRFNIDYSGALATQLGPSTRVVLVGDPGIDVSRITEDSEEQTQLLARLTAFLQVNDILPVWLSHVARKERYSEELLYPLFHYRTPPIGTGFSYLDWPAYMECNETFAHAISQVCKPNDWILIFNYHLMLLPQMLRQEESSKDAAIHFYVPTVFPSSEMYRILPQREELLKGVLSSNVISFHSHQYRTHFVTAVTRVLGVECTPHSVEPCVESGGTGVRVCVTPLGVEIGSWESAAAILDINSLKERFHGRKIILGVDTLDYTKGLPQKMLAFRRFLMSHPSWATKVVFIQLCFLGRKPSIDAGHSSSLRLSSLDRKEILTQVFQVSGNINSSFGTVDHLPVHFLLGTFSVQELLPVFAMADIGLMTALRESISTAVYQFVLCQKHTNKGVIILSEFSGSAQMLGAAAIQVNPWNINAVATSIGDALTMPEDEKNERHDLAYQIVAKHDPSAWARQIITDFQEAIAECDEERVEVPPPLQINKAVSEVVSAKHIFIVTGIKETLLRAPPAMLDVEAIHPRAKKADYDNEPEDDPTPSEAVPRPVEDPFTVETPPGCDPQLGSPTALTMARSVEQDIVSLANCPNCSVIIVSSSSVPAVEVVLQNCPNVHAFAENGHYYRKPNDTVFVPFTQSVPDDLSLSKDHDLSGSFSAPDNVSHTTSRMPSQDGDTDQKVSESMLEECLAKVQELIDYFAKRTPGSYMRKTETSISWHYGNADKGFASNQARDLLFHLWSGPLLNNSLLELCVGKSSVEVRSCKQTKVQVVEWVIKDIMTKNDLSVSDIAVLCIGNYLPRDEEIYNMLTKIMRGPRRSRTSIGPEMKSPSLSRFPEIVDQRHVPRCITCTVGVRYSKAAYRLDTKNLIAHLLRQLNEALLSRDYPQMTTTIRGTCTPSRESVGQEPRALIPASPSVDVAIAMASPEGFPAQRQGDYYKYLPIGRTIGESRVLGNLSPHKSPTRPGRKTSIKQEVSDVEEDDAEDEEEMFVLGAGQALNVASGIPFTHARPQAASWSSVRPASVSPRWMTGHTSEGRGLFPRNASITPNHETSPEVTYSTPFSSISHTRANSGPREGAPQQN